MFVIVAISMIGFGVMADARGKSPEAWTLALVCTGTGDNGSYIVDLDQEKKTLVVVNSTYGVIANLSGKQIKTTKSDEGEGDFRLWYSGRTLWQSNFEVSVGVLNTILEDDGDETVSAALQLSGGHDNQAEDDLDLTCRRKPE